MFDLSRSHPPLERNGGGDASGVIGGGGATVPLVIQAGSTGVAVMIHSSDAVVHCISMKSIAIVIRAPCHALPPIDDLIITHSSLIDPVCSIAGCTRRRSYPARLVPVAPSSRFVLSVSKLSPERTFRPDAKLVASLLMRCGLKSFIGS